MAIASLVLGIFLFCPLSIPAIILGHMALSQIKKSAGGIGGRGLAIAGLVLGYLGIALIPFVLIIAAIAIPNLLRARNAANEAVSGGLAQDYQHCASDLSIPISHDRICSRPDVFGRQRPLYQQPSYGLSD